MSDKSMTIVEKSLVFTAKDRRTNVCIDFDVNEEFAELVIECRYYPKKLEDAVLSKKMIEEALHVYYGGNQEICGNKWHEYLPIVNHATISLDCLDEYIGCAHRHNPEQTIIISEKFSSPGFIKRKPGPGRWRAVINIHEVVTGRLNYYLKITGKKAE